ncbi:single-stranded DNA-binding protein [Nitrosomonas aestuarii]|nr:single-stranded DNA-binding protein [Nitrosomonas aestuarii]
MGNPKDFEGSWPSKQTAFNGRPGNWLSIPKPYRGSSIPHQGRYRFFSGLLNEEFIMLNKVHIIGYLGSNPDIRYSQGGTAIANLRIATSERWKKDGEKKEKTEWHTVVLFDKLAELAKQYLQKGSLVYIEGKLQTRSWDKDGEERFTTEIMAESMKMLPGNNGNKSKGGHSQQNDRPF